MSLYRRVLAYYRPDFWPTITAMVLTLIANAFGIMRLWPLKYIIDKVLPAATRTPHGLAIAGIDLSSWSIPAIVALVCVLMIVFQFVSGGIGYLVNVITIRVGLHGLMRLRTELYAYLHSLPLKFHDQRRSADSSFRVAYDSQSVQAFYSKGFFIFQSVLSFAITFSMMWYFDSLVALISLFVIPMMMFAIYLYAKRIREQSTTVAERESNVLTVAQEGLSSIKMVQAFGREEDEVLQFEASARESLDANLKLNATSMKSALLVGTLIAASGASLYYVGALHVLSGRLTIGGITVLQGLLLMLYQPIEALTHIAWAFQGAKAGTQRCFEILDKENDVADAPGAKPIANTLGEIIFENVAFGYTSTREILRDVNLRISPGQTVAFVGGTGAGKSTLLSLVPRFYDPTAGSVLLDGRDLRTIQKKSLRDQISIVLQDTLLFSTTIRENIAYGRPNATEEEIIEAAKRAQAHDFIMATPDGYRSQVGERGGHLSVGQRQRLGIARAFLKNAPILILDEPTSALDPTTESAIMHTIEELMRGRTTLIITHRIATIHGMDKIVVLANGTVAEEGKGPELVQRGGVYASLYRSANLT